MTNNDNQIWEKSLVNNNLTLQSYEVCALQYATSVSKEPTPTTRKFILYMAAIAGKGGIILEVGSGPGWDADFVESLGVTVRRTDATGAFRNFQTGRGKKIDPLNLITDDFGGSYDGIMALYVLQHIGRDKIPMILQKVTNALRFGGSFLVSLREGEGELWERGDASGDYHVVLWKETDFVEALKSAGLEVILMKRNIDTEGSWMTFLARKNL